MLLCMRNGHTARSVCAHLASSYLMFTKHALFYRRHEVSLCRYLRSTCLVCLLLTNENKLRLRYSGTLLDLVCLVARFVGKC